MNQSWPKRGFVALCVLFGLLVAGVGPVAADELSDEHDADGEVCDLLYADAYAEVDSLTAGRTVDYDNEVDVLTSIQAVVSQLNYDVQSRDCAVESP